MKTKMSDRDLLDKIDDFIENHIEEKIKKGLDDIEGFLKRDLKDLARKRKHGGAEDDDGLFSYLECFLKDRKVASVAPSTKFLIANVFKRMDLKHTATVIEYGPAAGVMTKRLLPKLPANGRVLAVERNPEFVASLRRLNDPRLTVIEGSVTEIDKYASSLNLPPADAIISGIPFSFLKPIERHELLHKTVDLLRPGGRFIAYQVTTHLAALMKYHFQDVTIDYVVRNLPPHFVFTGYK